MPHVVIHHHHRHQHHHQQQQTVEIKTMQNKIQKRKYKVSNIPLYVGPTWRKLKSEIQGATEELSLLGWMFVLPIPEIPGMEILVDKEICNVLVIYFLWPIKLPYKEGIFHSLRDIWWYLFFTIMKHLEFMQWYTWFLVNPF